MTFTQRLRAKVNHKINPCPLCNGGVKLTLRVASEQNGVSKATLSRFLSGKSVDSDTIDLLEVWTTEK